MQQIKRGFTLVELLIVIILIGVVYMLFIAGLDKNEKPRPLRFEELRSTILNLTRNTPATLTCDGDTCGHCVIRPREGEKELEIDLFRSRPKVLYYDRYGYIKERRFPGEICFEYTIRKNLSGDNILVERGGIYYLFYAYLKKADVFNTYDEAAQAFDPARHIPMDTHEYYYERQ